MCSFPLNRRSIQRARAQCARSISTMGTDLITSSVQVDSFSYLRPECSIALQPISFHSFPISSSFPRLPPSTSSQLSPGCIRLSLANKAGSRKYILLHRQNSGDTRWTNTHTPTLTPLLQIALLCALCMLYCIYCIYKSRIIPDQLAFKNLDECEKEYIFKKTCRPTSHLNTR